MNSKRMKLRVATACTAVLLVGSMMGSSASVFASSEGASIILPVEERPVRDEQVEQWLAEAAQMDSQFQEVTDEETKRIRQQSKSQQEELARLRAEKTTLQTRLETDPNNSKLAWNLRQLEYEISRQNSAIRLMFDQKQVYSHFLRRARGEKEKYRSSFEESMAELIRLQEDRDQFRSQVGSNPKDIGLKIQLQLREILASQQKRRTQQIFELLKDCYKQIMRAIEKPFLQMDLFMPKSE